VRDEIPRVTRQNIWAFWSCQLRLHFGEVARAFNSATAAIVWRTEVGASPTDGSSTNKRRRSL
jgi:hypothetical protein